MAKTIIAKLIREFVGSIPRPSDAVGRLNVVKNALREIRALGADLPSMSKTLAAFRKEAFGVSNAAFKQAFTKIASIEPSIARQQLLSGKERVPATSIPIADVTAQTKYLYKYTLNVYDKVKGEWNEQWVTIGSDTKLTADQAWQRFSDSFLDSIKGGINTLYKNEVDKDSVEFQGVWRAATVVKDTIE